MIHNLKIKEKYADAICGGAKNFELRKEDDKHFEAGDIITFKVVDWNEHEHEKWEEHHGIEGRAYFIPYVLRSEDFPEGIKEGYCVFTIAQLSDDLAYYYTHDMGKRH